MRFGLLFTRNTRFKSLKIDFLENQCEDVQKLTICHCYTAGSLLEIAFFHAFDWPTWL